MGAFKYMKVDYLLTKQQMRIVPFLFIVAALVGVGSEDVGVLFTCSYLLFIATIFSTTPFGSCQRNNTGFLLMLPGTVTERVTGRFLFGLSYLVISGLLCLASMGVYHLLGYGITRMTVGIFLCNLALSVCIMALEYLLSYLFGEGKGNWQYLGIVRTVPGMAVFFLFMFIYGKMDEEIYVADRMEFLTPRIVTAGAFALAGAFLVVAVAIVICVKVIERRDYA